MHKDTVGRLFVRGYKLFRFYRVEFALMIMKMRRKKNINNANFFERTIYSESGEDGIIEIIFYAIGTTNKFFVEIGVGDGSVCNTRYLLTKGWDGIMIDAKNNKPPVRKEFVNAENVNDIFKKYNVPEVFDLLSIDIDFNDYWVWQALENYSPRVVVIEYNSTHQITESKVVKYDQKAMWDGTNYFGASLLALVKLAKIKGYTLVGCNNKGVNAFFVRDDLIEGNFEIKSIEKLYKPPKYGERVNGVHIGHPKSDKPWIMV